MRKSEIIKKYKKDRNIQDNYKFDEDEMYLIEEIQKALKQGQLLPIDSVSKRSELLPDFLYEDDGIIKVGVQGDSEVTNEWNDYLKKLGNCC
jgi:hypothetical protein